MSAALNVAEAVTFDGVWRPVSSPVAGLYNVARSYRLDGGAPAQEVLKSDFDLFSLAEAEAVSAGLNASVRLASDLAILRDLFEKVGGEAWEPKNPRHAFIARMVEAGFLRRLDGRCGFEAFRDSHVGWTAAGLAAVKLGAS